MVFRVSKEEIAQSATDAVKIAKKIGFPLSPKSSARTSCTNPTSAVWCSILTAPAAVTKAFNRHHRAGQEAEEHEPKLEGILIAQQVRPISNSGVGTIARCRDGGRMVLLGTGGFDIELLKDVALAGAPLDEAEASALIAAPRPAYKMKGYLRQAGAAASRPRQGAGRPVPTLWRMQGLPDRLDRTSTPS